jgi:SAM-dependent methyltransferase
LQRIPISLRIGVYGATQCVIPSDETKARVKLKMGDLISSYTNTRLGLSHRVWEAIQLFKRHRAGMNLQVQGLLSSMDYARAVIEVALGAPLTGQRIMEIGPGQQLRQARYFASDNDVVAVDLDEITLSANPIALLRALRFNGPIRFLKTVVRKLAGYDRQFIRELIRQKPATANSRPRVLRRDASNTGLSSASFDCVMSYSVFEHLRDPGAVLREIFRLLRAGGISHHVVHIYSSDSGAHDARTFTDNRAGLPYWCHLQPDQAHLVASNCYVNKLTLAQWLTLFEQVCPGVSVEYFRADDAASIAAFAALRARGALSDYTDDELMTNCLQFTWEKSLSQ